MEERNRWDWKANGDITRNGIDVGRSPSFACRLAECADACEGMADPKAAIKALMGVPGAMIEALGFDPATEKRGPMLLAAIVATELAHFRERARSAEDFIRCKVLGWREWDRREDQSPLAFIEEEAARFLHYLEDDLCSACQKEPS